MCSMWRASCLAGALVTELPSRIGNPRPTTSSATLSCERMPGMELHGGYITKKASIISFHPPCYGYEKTRSLHSNVVLTELVKHTSNSSILRRGYCVLRVHLIGNSKLILFLFAVYLGSIKFL